MVLKANTDQFVADAERHERTWSGAAFWWRWVGATTLGWVIGYAITGALAGLTGESETPLIRGAGTVTALVTIGLQWVVIRPWLVRAWRWIPVSFAGEAIGLALLLATQVLLRNLLGGETVIPEALVELLVTALPTAILQWLLLRTVAQRAWRWLLANLFWIVLFIPVVLFFALLGAAGADDRGATVTGIGPAVTQAGISAVIGAILGFIASAITGAEMAWLLRHQKER